jgi:hypothetical protein
MKATITDPRTIDAVSPIDLAAYLRTRAWQLGGELPSRLGWLWLWKLENGDKVDVVVPADRTVRDFRRRIIETLQTLETIEQRSQLEILADIQHASADVFRWRWIEGNVEDGTVPLELGQQFIVQVRSQLLAAACSAVHPGQFFASRKPALATEYIRQARLGQSERGSYVITVHSPVPPVITMEGFQEESEPFERRVTLTLANALRVLRHFAAKAVGTGIPATQELSRDGVSANLCESVAAMLGTEGIRRDVEVRFSFASSRPVLEHVSSFTRFSSDLSPVIGEIAKVLRETATREDFELVGFVTNLNRQPQDTSGIAVIQGQIDEVYRRVEIEVAESEYDTILTEAHRDRLMVRCEGELQKVKGKTYRLLNARGFELLLP